MIADLTGAMNNLGRMYEGHDSQKRALSRPRYDINKGIRVRDSSVV